MKLHRKRTVAVLSIACLFLLGGSSTASEAGRQGAYLVTGAAAQFYGYATPVMVVEAGGELSYANFDIVQHDVVHDVAVDGFASKKKQKWCRAFDKGECPLFWSARAGLGETVGVEGLRNLKPGQIYSFYCTLHPGMKGKLAVR